jgi:hypothetical protein
MLPEALFFASPPLTNSVIPASLCRSVYYAPGEAANCKSYDMLIGLPEHTPNALLADKAYDTDAIGSDFKKRAIGRIRATGANLSTRHRLLARRCRA